MDFYPHNELCLLAVFHIWRSSFPSTIVGTGCPFSIVCFGTFVENQLAVDAGYLSADEWRKKVYSSYTIQCHPTIKNNTILSFLAKQVELEDIVLNKTGQTT